MKPILTHID